MNKTAKKIWDIATTALVVLVVILATLLVGARFIGLTPFTVLSGSMEPTYHVGSLIYVKKVDPYTLAAGDVITYSISEEMVATHRIVEVIPDEEDPAVIRFKTKGDANEAEDGSLVYYENVQGTPIFTIPYLGYIANYIQNPPGTYFAIAAAAIILLMVFIPDLLEKEKKETEEK
ncbi:MAG: signal peptidase I [Christensenellaceae bacterium]|nr:signal peptidase I [Christensenellaceae bacterium]